AVVLEIGVRPQEGRRCHLLRVNTQPISMESIPTKMDKADEHLDRLGSILRSLRAPPPDRELSSTAVPIDRPEARRQDRLRSSEDPQQQQQQQQH
ncbi:unnamed protein product, partial [Pylaiella littoralis]